MSKTYQIVWKLILGIILLLAHLLLRNQLWKNCKELVWHFGNFIFWQFSILSIILFVIILSTIIKLRIFVTAEPGDNSVEMKRVLQDYLRSMRISSEVCYRLLPNPADCNQTVFRLKLLRSTLKKLNHSWPIIRQAICSRTSSFNLEIFSGTCTYTWANF